MMLTLCATDCQLLESGVKGDVKLRGALNSWLLGDLVTLLGRNVTHVDGVLNCGWVCSAAFCG